MSDHHGTEHAHHVQYDVEGDDPFFAHDSEEMKALDSAHTEVANAKLITGVGVFGFLLVVVTCVIVYGYFRWYTVRVADRNVSQEGGSHVERDFWLAGGLRDLQTRWYSMTEPDWIEPDPNIPGDEPVLQLPMDAAKAATIAQYENR